MRKVRTPNDMQDELDKEMAWRVKEISVFKLAADKYEAKQAPYIRAGIMLLYAHWEGFIKEASVIYLSHVESKALRYRELKPCFAVLGLKREINTLVDSKKSRPNIEAMKFIMSKLDETAKLQVNSAVITESNLSSRVFENIAGSLDIDTSPYQTKFKLIDSSLVDRRNNIAHGEFLEVNGPGFFSLVHDIIELMRQYKTDIENAASMESYRRTL